MAVDKTKVDYDKDGILTASDRKLAERDVNADGKVDAKDEAARKKARKPKVSESVTTYDAQGRPVKTTTTTPMDEAEDAGPLPSARDFGISGQAAAQYGLTEFIQQMIDEGVTSKAEFFQRLEEHPFGKERTAAQEAFDIAIAGPEAEDLQARIENEKADLSAMASRAGVMLDDQMLTDIATQSVRNALQGQDRMLLFQKKIAEGFAPTAGAPTQGTAAEIYETFRNMARAYGLPINDSDLQQRTRDALAQGSNWQSWVESQREVFRSQAKNLYPTVAQQLDTSTITDIIDPYLNDAAEILGLNKGNLNPLDPTWLGALNGPNGPLSRDEWIRVLRTDPKFGFDRTVRARQEYAAVADEIIAAFARA